MTKLLNYNHKSLRLKKFLKKQSLPNNQLFLKKQSLPNNQLFLKKQSLPNNQSFLKKSLLPNNQLFLKKQSLPNNQSFLKKPLLPHNQSFPNKKKIHNWLSKKSLKTLQKFKIKIQKVVVSEEEHSVIKLQYKLQQLTILN